MKAEIISFTDHGAMLAQKLAEELPKHGICCEAWLKKKDAVLPEGVRGAGMSLKEWTGERFSSADALIFIGAAGIAVRSIAPFVQSKKTDPAVLVADEQGKHVISLLSGHIGGANALARLAAEILGAEPVITTATDLQGKFAVDAFAAGRGLYMDSMAYAREIAAALVAGKRVGMRSAWPVFGPVPEELDREGTPFVGFAVDVRAIQPFAHTLHLVPGITVLGVGCRKNTDALHLKDTVLQVLREWQVYPESICRIASIDLKEKEQGIAALADFLNVPFTTYSSEELEQVESENGFTESDFVRSVAGVGNVCERAALKGAGTKRLLIPKTAREGVTVAAAVMDYTVCIEE